LLGLRQLAQVVDGMNSEEDERESSRLRGCGGVPMLIGVVYVSSSKHCSLVRTLLRTGKEGWNLPIMAEWASSSALQVAAA